MKIKNFIKKFWEDFNKKDKMSESEMKYWKFKSEFGMFYY